MRVSLMNQGDYSVNSIVYGSELDVKFFLETFFALPQTGDVIPHKPVAAPTVAICHIIRIMAGQAAAQACD
jgi:hypothetical protein